LFLNGKKGISALQLQREISVTYKTAWRILHKIREAMGKDNDDDDDFTGLMQGITEADETYVGGKEENKHKHKKFTSVKSIVFGMINRDTQKAKAFLVESAKYHDLAEHIIKNVEMGSTLITDEHSSYRALKTYYKHKTICHSAKEYVRSDIHTNSIESFWSTLKRGIYGIYHHVSKKHLQNYVNELCFRYNNRENTMSFVFGTTSTRVFWIVAIFIFVFTFFSWLSCTKINFLKSYGKTLLNEKTPSSSIRFLKVSIYFYMLYIIAITMFLNVKHYFLFWGEIKFDFFA
jgi:transposase-like protein